MEQIVSQKEWSQKQGDAHFTPSEPLCGLFICFFQPTTNNFDIRGMCVYFVSPRLISNVMAVYLLHVLLLTRFNVVSLCWLPGSKASTHNTSPLGIEVRVFQCYLGGNSVLTDAFWGMWAWVFAGNMSPRCAAEAFVVLRLWASVIMGELAVESEVP